MSKKRRQPGYQDPTPVPDYLTDVDSYAPCPCGRPFNKGERIVSFEGEEYELKRVFHPECLEYLRREMEDDIDLDDIEDWDE